MSSRRAPTSDRYELIDRLVDGACLTGRMLGHYGTPGDGYAALLRQRETYSQLYGGTRPTHRLVLRECEART